jgi:hypothetical protein
MTSRPAAHHNQIRIVSDGTARDTVIYLDEKMVDRVIAAEIVLRADSVNEVKLQIQGTPLDVHGDLVGVSAFCPCCGDQIEHRCDL